MPPSSSPVLPVLTCACRPLLQWFRLACLGRTSTLVSTACRLVTSALVSTLSIKCLPIHLPVSHIKLVGWRGGFDWQVWVATTWRQALQMSPALSQTRRWTPMPVWPPGFTVSLQIVSPSKCFTCKVTSFQGYRRITLPSRLIFFPGATADRKTSILGNNADR